MIEETWRTITRKPASRIRFWENRRAARELGTGSRKFRNLWKDVKILDVSQPLRITWLW
jgi:hypothetical protein